MKRSLWAILLVVIALAACRKKEEPAPYPGIERLAGKWKLAAYEIKGVWMENEEKKGGYEFMIRYDGVILDQDGMKRCCDPASYFINGVRFDVVPGAPVKENPECARVDCFTCENANYDPQEDGSLIYYCSTSGFRWKYERL